MQTPANLADKRQGTAVECVAGFEREGQLLAFVRRRWRRDRAAVSRPIRPMARPTPTASSSSAPRSARQDDSVAVPRALQPFVDEPGACRAVRRLRRLAVARSCSIRRRRGRCRRRARRWRDSSRCSRRVAVVSGRPAAFLRDALAIDGLDVRGRLRPRTHRRRARWCSTSGCGRASTRSRRRPTRPRPRCRACSWSARARWRSPSTGGTSRNGATTPRAWAAEAAPRLGLEAPLRGRMAVELRPPVPVDKGTPSPSSRAACTVGCVRGRRRR